MHLDITTHMSTHLLNIYLVTVIYLEGDNRNIPRVNPSLTIAPGEYSCNVFVYPDRMTHVIYNVWVGSQWPKYRPEY